MKHARNTDPQTSHDAAASVDLPKQCARVLQCLRYHSRFSEDCTASEIVEMMVPKPQQSVVARRLTDLEERGLIERTGETRRGPSGRQLTVWRAL